MPSQPQSDLKPAKIITPAIRQRLQERLNEARKLSRAKPCPHGQIDELLCECVIVDPGSTVYIGALLHHLRRSDRPGEMTNDQAPMTKGAGRIGHWGLVIGHLSRLFRSPDPLPPIRDAAEKKDWIQVLTLAPPALCRQPQSVKLLRHLAAACAALEHEQAELCYLQAAVALAVDDAEVQRQLARALTRQGLFDDAAVAWKRLAEMLPEDEECRQTIKILCEYEPPAGRAGVLAEEEVQVLQAALENETVTLEQLRKLFDHLRAWQKFDEAQQLLDRAIGMFGANLTLLECREQLLIDRSDWATILANALGSVRDEYRQTSRRAMSQSVRTHLQVQYQRCERHPNDAALQLGLAQLLTGSGNYNEAQNRLTAVAEVPHLRAKALQSLGITWDRLKQADKAMSCFRESIQIALHDRDEQTAVWSLELAAMRASQDGDRELARELCQQALSLQSTDELVRIHQKFCRHMLDNLNGVCHRFAK